MITNILTNPLTGNALNYFQKEEYRTRQLLILGGGHNVWDDYAAFTRRSDGDVMAVNDVGMYFPHELRHWYSNHGDQLDGWNVVRQFHFDSTRVFHSNKEIRNPKYCFWPVVYNGTSSLAAATVGILMGYDRIVLCGIPLDDGGHFYNPRERSNFTNEAKERVWKNARDRWFDGKVKSMSGRSRDWLGSP